jgi:hypothetical protein
MTQWLDKSEEAKNIEVDAALVFLFVLTEQLLKSGKAIQHPEDVLSSLLRRADEIPGFRRIEPLENAPDLQELIRETNWRMFDPSRWLERSEEPTGLQILEKEWVEFSEM